MVFILATVVLGKDSEVQKHRSPSCFYEDRREKPKIPKPKWETTKPKPQKNK